MTLSGAADSAPEAPGRRAFAFMALLRRDVVVTGRELPSFLAQMVLQPFFLVFVFGRLLTDLGFARPGYAALLLPGVIALTVVLTALQSVALPMVIDFSFTREIEDRLLAPIPVEWVALEKVVFAAGRGLAAGLVMFPIGLAVLGSVPFEPARLPLLLAFAVLGAIAGGAMGLTLGTAVAPNRISTVFALVLTPLLFTGCSQYPWPALEHLRWFQVLTLANPLTYVAEGFRASMVPAVPHMVPAVALAALPVAIAILLAAGLRGFRRRALD